MGRAAGEAGVEDADESVGEVARGSVVRQPRACWRRSVPCHHAGVAADITFFLAPDDETAAETRSSHPGRALTGVNCTGFDPDDAVVDWTAFFDG